MTELSEVELNAFELVFGDPWPLRTIIIIQGIASFVLSLLVYDLPGFPFGEVPKHYPAFLSVSIGIRALLYALTLFLVWPVLVHFYNDRFMFISGMVLLAAQAGIQLACDIEALSNAQKLLWFMFSWNFLVSVEWMFLCLIVNFVKEQRLAAAKKETEAETSEEENKKRN